MQHPSKNVRRTVMIILVVFAVVNMFATPLIVKDILPSIINNQQAKFEKMSTSDNPEDVKKAPLIEDTPFLVSFFYPLWMALAMFGSVAVIVTSKAFYEGEVWAKGVALLGTALPSMAGAYMLIPWMNFIGFDKGFPAPVIIALLGLIPYFTILLAEKVDGKTKLANFIVFLMLGITAAHSFTNGHAAFRFQWMHPARPLWPEGTWVLWLATQFNWMGTICLILSIYYLGVKQKKGWYLAMIGGVTYTFAMTWTHLVRGTTIDYILGAVFGAIVIALLLIPFFKERILE